MIAPTLIADEAIRRRFLRESRVAASIDHPHVIPIYYTGEEGGIAYIAMRHVAGDDLRTLVRRTGPLDPARAARIVGQVAAALDAAHASGLVHRDVKPANVLLGQGDHAYLTDFGLTKHVLSEAGATKPGHWVGTLDFIAPEQIRGERVDARADVYALGCVLHYMLAGRPPFTPDGDEAKMWAHLTERPPLVSEAAPGVPEGFDDVIARALAKDPAQRFQSAGDLGRAAAAAAAGGPVAGRDTVVATGAAAPIEIDTRTAGTAIAPPSRRRAPPARKPSRLFAVAAVAVTPRRRRRGRRARHARGGRRRQRTRPRSRRPAEARAQGHATRDRRPPQHRPRRRRPRLGRPLPERRAASRSTRRRESAPGPRPEIGVGLTGLAVSGRDHVGARGPRRQLVHLDARPAGGRRPGAAARRRQRGRGDPDAVYVAVTQPELDPGDQILEIDARPRAPPHDRRARRRAPARARPRPAVAARQHPAELVGIDLATRADRRRVTLDPNTSGDLTVGAGYLWVTLVDSDQLARVDPRGGTAGDVRRPAAARPASSVRKGIVWVVNRTESTLTRIDIRRAARSGARSRCR